MLLLNVDLIAYRYSLLYNPTHSEYKAKYYLLKYSRDIINSLPPRIWSLKGTSTSTWLHIEHVLFKTQNNDPSICFGLLTLEEDSGPNVFPNIDFYSCQWNPSFPSGSKYLFPITSFVIKNGLKMSKIMT